MRSLKSICRFGPPSPFIPDPPGADDDRFANAFKNWREWNVALGFLTNLHCGIEEHHVFCSPLDPPDVLCRGANFEIKEIMDKGRKRHDEIKAYQRIQQMNPQRRQVRTGRVIDMRPNDVADLVGAELEALDQKGKYTPEWRSTLDLLFYVNLLDHWFEAGDMPDPSQFEKFGWRSISAAVAANTSLVFFSTMEAPDFIRANTGKVRERVETL